MSSETRIEQGTPRTIKGAAVLGALFGAVTAVTTPPVLLELQRTGELPISFGVRALGGGPFEALPVQTLMVLGWAFVGLNVLELLAARWLWQGRRRGAWLAVLLSIAGAPFWIGFALPHWLIVGPLRVVLLWRGWASLR